MFLRAVGLEEVSGNTGGCMVSDPIFRTLFLSLRFSRTRRRRVVVQLSSNVLSLSLQRAIRSVSSSAIHYISLFMPCSGNGLQCFGYILADAKIRVAFVFGI